MFARLVYLLTLLLVAAPEPARPRSVSARAAALNSALQTAAARRGRRDPHTHRQYPRRAQRRVLHLPRRTSTSLSMALVYSLHSPAAFMFATASTVLSGSGVGACCACPGRGAPLANLSVEGMTLRDGATPVRHDGGGGGLHGEPASAATSRSSSVLFESNTAQCMAAAPRRPDGGGVFVLRNSVFRFNTIAGLYGAAFVAVNAQHGASERVDRQQHIRLEWLRAGGRRSCNGALASSAMARMALVNNAFAFNNGLRRRLGSDWSIPLEQRAQTSAAHRRPPPANLALADPTIVLRGRGDYRCASSRHCATAAAPTTC